MVYDGSGQHAGTGAGLALAVRRRTVTRTLLATVAILTILSAAGQVAKHVFGFPTMLGFVSLSYVDLENNFPTWYQTMALAFAAVLFALVAVARYRAGAAFARHWIGLALIFVALSLDEAGSIHERSIEPLQRVVGVLPGPWQPTWILLGIAAVVVVAGIYLQFVWHLPRRERAQLVVAAAFYVGGAIGVEMATGAVLDTSDPAHEEAAIYVVLAHVEELMEMLGVVVLIDFLLRCAAQAAPFYIRIGD